MLFRNRVTLFSSCAVILGAAVVAAPLDVVTAAPAPVAVYDAINNPMPPNVPSLGFQATQTSELGDLVQLAPGPRRLTSVTVMMSSWGCQSGGWNTNDCTTSPGAKFIHPLTLNVYRSDPTSATGVGTQVATVTQNFDIPFRPSADPSCVGADVGKWRSGGACYNGFATPVTFDFPALPTVPTNLIWTIAYNTSNYGSAPIGGPCTNNCAYDSLNVGLSGLAAPLAGVDLDPAGAVNKTATAGNYCVDPGAGGVSILRVDAAPGCWTGYRPMARITTVAASETETTQVVNAADTTWAFFAESPAGAPVTGSYVTGPATPPLGTGSAQLTVAASNEGQALGKAFLAGTRLDRLTRFEYWSHQPAGTLAPSLQFNVSYSGATTYEGRLVFEPTNIVGPVPAGWQRWNTLAGKWWATRTPGNSVGNCPQSSPCTWSQVLVKFPDAQINPNPTFGAVLFKAGSGWSTPFTGNVDALTIGIDDGAGNIAVTNYDFEPTAPPVPLVAPQGVNDFNPVTPTRVFDTRAGTGPNLRDVPKAKVGPSTPLEVKLTDLPGLVPATGAAAVSINVTSTQSEGHGYITAIPCGADDLASSVNFQAGRDRANAVIAPVSPTGTVCFTASTLTDIAVDVNGWFKSPPGLHPIDPTRLFDTRTGTPAALRDVPKTRLVPGTPLEVKVTDLPGGFVPASGVGAVSINTTSTQSIADGFVTVSPCGTENVVSNLNFQAGEDAANLVLTPVSPSGTICFTASAPTDLVVDVTGWLKNPSGFTAVNPARVADTRPGTPSTLRTVRQVPVGPGSTLELKLVDLPGGLVPASGVGAVSINMTSTRSQGDGFLTVNPCGSTNAVSNVNFQTGRDRANAVVTPLSSSGTVCITSSVATDVVVDVNGWFSDTPTS